MDQPGANAASDIGLEFVAREFPEPIADIAAQWSRIAVNGEPMAVLKALVAAFEVTAHFLGIIGVAEYVRAHKALRLTSEADRALALLRDSHGISAGSWWQIFLATVGAFKGQREALVTDGLYSLRFPSDRRRRDVPELFNAAVYARNRLYHAYGLPTSEIDETITTLGNGIRDVYAELRFLSHFRLVRVMQALPPSGEPEGPQSQGRGGPSPYESIVTRHFPDGNGSARKRYRGVSCRQSAN
jgi:hypothetical protein